MLADGLFTRFKKPDFAFALHAGGVPYGYVNYRRRRRPRPITMPYIQFRGRAGSRADAAAHDRSRDDGGALHRRRADRDQPRKGPD